MTSNEGSRKSIDHPSRRMSDDVAASFRKFSEQDDEELAHRQKLAELSRPTKEERRELSDIYQSIAQIDVEQSRKLQDIDNRRVDRVREEVKERGAWLQKNLFNQPPGVLGNPEGPSIPPAVDHTFWWAHTEINSSSSFDENFQNDGAHFFGGAFEHDGDLMQQSFTFEALFELQPERIPESPSGRWLSTPHVELFGAFVWNTLRGPLDIPDTWAKVWMKRKQQIFQPGFGMDGPTTIVRGEAEEVQTLLFEEDSSRHGRVAMPGFQFMPPVLVTNVSRPEILSARLRIEFDIQVELGSVDMDPHIIIHTLQWPLQPML